MKRLKYHFVTEWRLKAPASRVWEALKDVETMFLWWLGVKKAQIRGNDKTLKVGTILDFTVKGLLGDLKFTLEVAEIEAYKKLLFKSDGDLKGFGLWTIEAQNGESRTIFLWEVTTTGWLMNLAGVLFKPLLKRNHARVMAAGYRVLKSRLES